MLRPFRLLTPLLVCVLSVASFATAGGGDVDAATTLVPCSSLVGVQCQHTHCNQFGCNTFTCLQYVGLGSNHPGLGSCTHIG